MYHMLPYYAGVYAYEDLRLHPNFPKNDPEFQRPLKLGALYNLWWDPAEHYDLIFNGATPTGGNQSSPGRYSGQDSGWIGLYINPHLVAFFDELKKYPNIAYVPWGEGLAKIIPDEFK